MNAVEPGYVALAIQKAYHGLVLSQIRRLEKVLWGEGPGRMGRMGGMDITRKYPSNSLEDKSSRC